jgi:protein-L-isoaspartate(D-aspartate) O-methyltransferase
LTDELARMRERLATRVLAAHRICSERVAAALHAVPRHLFLPEQPPEAAYRDDAIVTKRDEAGQPISSSSQPAIMAIMLDQLDLAPGLRVLEIGAGTGYNAALISHVVGPTGQVTSIDIDPDLVEAAREHLARAGFGEVVVACADGAWGYPERAPYDRIIATVGVSDLAPAWLGQADPQARIVVPLDVRGTQLSVAFERAGPGGPWTSRSLAPCGFMRMRGSLAGPERVVHLAPGLFLLLPDGSSEVDGDTLAAWLAGPSVPYLTGVRAGSAQRRTASRAARHVRRPAHRGAAARPGLAVHARAPRPRRAGHPHLSGGLGPVRPAHARRGRVRPGRGAASRRPRGARRGLEPGGPARHREPAHRRLPEIPRLLLSRLLS